MSLSSLQLDAFVAVARVQSFSGAAKALNITQSALSQRILNLESDLGSTLFLREPSGIRLTELGQKLLRYCQMKDSLEDEFTRNLKSKKKHELSGLIRFGGFSTVTRSVILPSLNPIFLENSDVQLELLTKEIRELPRLLETGEADFIFLNGPCGKQGIENIEIGFEENVLVQPALGLFREDVFLDHDSEDSTTIEFFKLQSQAPKTWRRSYFDEIYAIIDGVLTGVGRAVIPLHLARQIEGLKICKGYKSLKSPVYFCYYRQSFYTSLQKRVIMEVKARAPKLLK
jgi:DNA-binding transcriptional LysR family regulator